MKRKKYILPILLFIVTLLVYLLTSPGKTPYDYFTRLADSFIKGRYWLSDNPPWLNELIPGGNLKYFVPYPPMPALMSIPFVLILKKLFEQQYLAHILGAGIGITTFYISLSISKNKKIAIWSYLLITFGNIIWYMSSVGSSWYIGQICATFFLTMAIYEGLNKKRPIVVGALLGAAYLSRLQTILAFPLLFYLVKKDFKLTTLKFLLGLSPFFLFNFFYNFVRYGVIWDKSYVLIPNLFDEPWYQKGLFNLSNIPSHLKILFLKLPILKNQPPYVQPSWAGMSIFITTPAFIFSLKSQIKEVITKLSWLSILLISLVIFSHGTTGFTQFGYRFAVDFYPILMLLTIKGVVKTGLRWYHWTLLVFCILVNLWGVLWINKFGWVSF